MKKIIYSILGFTTLALTSCDYHDPNDGKFGAEDSQAGWVGFVNDDQNLLFSNVTVAPNTSIASEVPVVINAPVNTSGLTVNYTVEAVEGDISYVASSGSLYFEKGEVSKTIELPVTGEATCSVFNVTLTSTSRDNVTVGLDGNSVISHQFIVSPFDREAMIGSYDAVLSDSTGSNQFVMGVAAGEADNEIILSNVFGAGSSAKATLLLNLDGSVSFTSPAENYLFSDPDVGDLYFSGSSGSYNLCINDGTIDVDFYLQANNNGETALYGPYNMVLTKQ